MMLTIGLSSCVGDLDVTPIDPSKNTEVDADGLFNKCYANLVLEGYGPGNSELGALGDGGTFCTYRLMWSANEATTDETACHWTDGGLSGLVYDNYDPTNTMLYGLYWRLCYGVSLCNQYLAAVDDPDASRVAEIHFLRALYYYYLLDNFGNVSFATEVSSSNPVQIKRADLYKFIVAELEENMDKMLAPAPRKKGEANYGRADQCAAWMLLARLYLNAQVYTGTADWANAKKYAEMVITKGNRSLCTGEQNGWSGYQRLFMGDNDVTDATGETIFSLIQDGEKTASYAGSTFLIAATWDGNMLSTKGTTCGISTWGGFNALHPLVNAFITDADLDGLDSWTPNSIIAKCGDQRALFYGDNANGDGGKKDRSYKNEEIAFAKGLGVTKFSNIKSTTDQGGYSTTYGDMDVILMRLAEAYLIYAEADMRGSNATQSGQTSTEYINKVRARAGLTGSALKNSYSLNEVFEERSRELYFEALRRQDLIRFGRFGGNNDYLWPYKGSSTMPGGTQFEEYRNIFPIPSTERGSNPNLEQNPGYPQN